KLETGHYTSKIYKKTLGAGMIATKSTFPYGWTSLVQLWSVPKNKPTGLYTSQNGNNYIKYPTLKAGVKAVIATLERYNRQGGSAANYGSQDPNYLDKLNSFDATDLITRSVSGNKYLK